jgi:hypothetical protein
MTVVAKPEEKRLIRLVVRHSVSALDLLPTDQRADLLEGAALLLEGEEADEASAAAHHIRQAEAAQLKFRELLFQK